MCFRSFAELKETVSRVSADIRSRVADSLRSTVDALFALTGAAPPGFAAPEPAPEAAKEVTGCCNRFFSFFAVFWFLDSVRSPQGCSE